MSTSQPCWKRERILSSNSVKSFGGRSEVTTICFFDSYSLLKVLKIGFAFTTMEFMILGVGMFTAFIVSILVIKFLMSYIKKHDFKVFGYYRIILGILVIGYFLLLAQGVLL